MVHNMSKKPVIDDFYAGDDEGWEVTFTDDDDNPVSTDGGTLEVFFKVNFGDPDSAAVISTSKLCTEADPLNPRGIQTISVSKIQTNVTPGLYHWLFRFTDASGVRTTLLASIRMEFGQQVTQRVNIMPKG
jgi:hypothetical protein